MNIEVRLTSRTYISRIELKYIALSGRIRERNDITAYTCRIAHAFGVNIMKYAIHIECLQTKAKGHKGDKCE